MFILIVARGYPKNNNDLNGIFEFDQAKALHKYGHKIVFVSLDLRSFRRKRKLGKYWKTIHGIDIINISIPLGAMPKSILLFSGKCALRMIYPEILQRHGKPDIIHAHFTLNGNIASILKSKFKIPLVITEHSSIINKKKLTKEVLRLGRNTYLKADKLISVSSILKENIKNHWQVESIVIHNIVDTSVFRYSEQKSRHYFTFLSVGDLIYGKGFDILLKAFKNNEFNSNVKLKIVGEGPLHADLQNFIDNAGLTNQITLMGFLNRNNIAKLMEECDAFVLASRSETFGVVYIEAMLAGLPVISTLCGGPEDFINKDNGLLTSVNDINALSNALKKMHDLFSDYDRKAISDQCIKNFSPETIASQLTKVYSTIIDN